MREPQLRRVHWLAQNHKSNWWDNWDSKPGQSESTSERFDHLSLLQKLNQPKHFATVLTKGWMKDGSDGDRNCVFSFCLPQSYGQRKVGGGLRGWADPADTLHPGVRLGSWPTTRRVWYNRALPAWSPVPQAQEPYQPSRPPRWSPTAPGPRASLFKQEWFSSDKGWNGMLRHQGSKRLTTNSLYQKFRNRWN